jgi:hypothetical protein
VSSPPGGTCGIRVETRCRSASLARDRPHRIDPDDDRAARVERQLVTNLATTEQLPEQTALMAWQTNINLAAVKLDAGHVILAAVDPEAASELVHRDVRAAFDEPTELRGGAVGPVGGCSIACQAFARIRRWAPISVANFAVTGGTTKRLSLSG